MSKLLGWGLVVLAAGALLGGSRALAADAPGTPPPWNALVHCAEIADDDDSLACFRNAMKAAGYRPTVQAETERRRLFGVIPRRSKPKGSGPEAAPAQAAAPPADKNRVTVTLAEVAVIPPANKLLLVTSDGAVWRQVDVEQVSPFPRAGQEMEIRRNSFGGYLCSFDKHNTVRCERAN